MIISLDYDETVTLDPVAWGAFIKFFQSAGHTVHIVTWRYPQDCDDIEAFANSVDVKVFATGRKGKREFMKARGIDIDVFIDDYPEAIIADQVGFKYF